jgi:hypothetical protein
MDGVVLAGGGHLPARKTAEMASRERAANRTDDRARSVPRRSAANVAADRQGTGGLAHDGGQIDRKGAFARSMASVSQSPLR